MAEVRSNPSTMTGSAPKLLLASASPRRRDLLTEFGYDFTVVIPTIEEPATFGPGVSPAQFAEAVSFFKARSVVGGDPDRLILAADTVVALDERVFGKPADRNDARRILTTLGGTTHQVITGVTLLDPRGARRMIDHDVTRVTMRRMSESELVAYLDSGEWQGKAGAYGIQDRGDQFVISSEGSFTNVVGLPMELLEKMLQAWPPS